MSNDKNKGVNPVVAGIVGAAVGAIVGAGAEALREYDEKNPGKINKKVDAFKAKGEKALGEIKQKALDVEGRVKEFASKAGEQVEEEKATVKRKLKA